MSRMAPSNDVCLLCPLICGHQFMYRPCYPFFAWCPSKKEMLCGDAQSSVACRSCFANTEKFVWSDSFCGKSCLGNNISQVGAQDEPTAIRAIVMVGVVSQSPHGSSDGSCESHSRYCFHHHRCLCSFAMVVHICIHSHIHLYYI